MQHTIASKLVFHGVGLHAGLPARMEIHPSAANTGLVFVRADVADKPNRVPVQFNACNLQRAVLCTWLENEHGVAAQTVEHVLSALYAYGIDNAEIRLEGPEVPILDGSSAPYATVLDAVRRVRQNAPRRVLKIVKDVRVQDGDRFAQLSPSVDNQLTIDYTVDFPGLGTQHRVFILSNPADYAQDIAPARTFTMKSVVETLQSRGLALGGTLDNAVVIDDATGKPVAGQTLRFADEAVRHKILDAIGDVALAGAAITGVFTCVKGGHALTNMLLRAVFADPDNYTIINEYAGVVLPNDVVETDNQKQLA